MSAKPARKNNRQDMAKAENILPAAPDNNTTIVAIGASAGGIL
jgi:chemotaxis response regulator CheB